MFTQEQKEIKIKIITHSSTHIIYVLCIFVCGKTSVADLFVWEPLKKEVELHKKNQNIMRFMLNDNLQSWVPQQQPGNKCVYFCFIFEPSYIQHGN